MGRHLLVLLAVLGLACTGPTGNHSPTIARVGAQTVSVGDTLTLEFAGIDDDGDGFSLRFQLTLFPGQDQSTTYQSSEGLTGLRWSSGGGRALFQWSPGANHVGTNHQLIVVAIDDHGGQSELSVPITVEPGEVDSSAEPGAPRFVVHANLVLDPQTSKCVTTRIRVDDPDSLEVKLTLIDAPPGMKLENISSDGKEADLSWCPEENDLGNQSVFSFFVVADDGEHRTKRRMTVVVRGNAQGPSSECGGTPPLIEHTALEDQVGNEDYLISAKIVDTESTIRDAWIMFTWQDPNLLETYVTAEMDDVGEDKFMGALPNITELMGTAPAEPVRIHYYLNAVDNDDAEGDRCDNLGWAPKDTLYSFVTYPAETGPATSDCVDDAHEPNDDAGGAKALPQEGGRGLILCPGQSDWWSLDIPQGAGLVGELYTAMPDAGFNLELTNNTGAAFGDATPMSGGTSLQADNLDAGTYYIQVTNNQLPIDGLSYDLYGSIQAPAVPCPDDPGEPNNVVGEAHLLTAGDHGPFHLCALSDNADWFAIDLRNGQTMSVLATFSHEAGDLDLAVYSPVGLNARLENSDSEDDNESVEFTAPADGQYLIRVVPFLQATNSYHLRIAVQDPVQPPQAGCADDGGHEPNDDPESAQLLEGDVLACGMIHAENGASNDDWYRFDLEPFEGARIDVLFTHSFRGDIDAEITSADGRTLVMRSLTTNDNETLIFPGSHQGGSWRLRVHGFNGGENEYEIRITRNVFGAEGGCTEDAFEPNDRYEDRSFVRNQVDNEAEVLGLSYCGGDDWFNAFTAAGQTLLVELRYDARRGEIEMELLDADNQPVGVVDVSEGAILIEMADPGNYSVRIFGGGPPNLYSLTILRMSRAIEI